MRIVRSPWSATRKKWFRIPTFIGHTQGSRVNTIWGNHRHISKISHILEVLWSFWYMSDLHWTSCILYAASYCNAMCLNIYPLSSDNTKTYGPVLSTAFLPHTKSSYWRSPPKIAVLKISWVHLAIFLHSWVHIA